MGRKEAEREIRKQIKLLQDEKAGQLTDAEREKHVSNASQKTEQILTSFGKCRHKHPASITECLMMFVNRGELISSRRTPGVPIQSGKAKIWLMQRVDSNPPHESYEDTSYIIIKRGKEDPHTLFSINSKVIADAKGQGLKTQKQFAGLDNVLNFCEQSLKKANSVRSRK